MNKHYIVSGGIGAMVLAVAGGFLSMIYGPEPRRDSRTAIAQTIAPTQLRATELFHPPDPDQAPAQMRDQVRRGYLLILETRPAEHNGMQGRRLNCQNCHFEGGRARDGISLVGAWSHYPKVLQSDSGETHLRSIEQQIRFCYMYNLGVTAPDETSSEVQSITAYLRWISRGVPVDEKVSWLGVDPLKPKKPANNANGRQVYAAICSKCHGSDGQGNIGPALWGNESYTRRSQFAQPTILASFVHENMPFRKPDLTSQQAFDVATFITTRGRRDFGLPTQPASNRTTLLKPRSSLSPAPAGMTSAPPSPQQKQQQLMKIAQVLQQQRIARITPSQPATSGTLAMTRPSAPASIPAITTQQKVAILGRALPQFRVTKRMMESITQTARTKPGTTAGTPLIAPLPGARTATSQPTQPSTQP